MNSLNDFERQIEEKLAAQENEHRNQSRQRAELMHQFEDRHRRYTDLADRLVREVLRPRLARLTRHFDNASTNCADELGRHQCLCYFRHSPRFPATAKLELGISRDGGCDHLLVYYDLSILPVFFQFDGQDRLSQSLDCVNEDQVALWVENKLLAFMDIYLRLETTDQYQAENYVTDPVCGMRINRLDAAEQMSYQGETYYFCVPECRERFAADPEKHLGARNAV